MTAGKESKCVRTQIRAMSNYNLPPCTLSTDIDGPQPPWPDPLECQECAYLRYERAGMWIDNGATREQADNATDTVVCPECALDGET